jgi:hypothetical protein
MYGMVSVEVFKPRDDVHALHRHYQDDIFFPCISGGGGNPLMSRT